MNIQEAKAEICNTLRAYLAKDENGYYTYPLIRQRPLLLIGPPGIGKTAIMEQAAAECGVGLVAYTITHHTRQSAIGLPEIVKRNYGGKGMMVTDYTMSEIVASVYDCMEKTGRKEGILFIDEINCVSETLAPAMLALLQNKTFGSHKIPEGWILVAAGNPPEYNKSVREFDIVTLDRVRKLTIEPDCDIWLKYAGQQKVHQAIISYLSVKKNNFYAVENTVDGKFFVTARGWEDLSRLLQSYEKLGIGISKELVEEFLQKEETARDFAGFYQLYTKYGEDYEIPSILSGNLSRENLALKEKMAADGTFEERFAVVNLILGALREKAEEYGQAAGALLYLIFYIVRPLPVKYRKKYLKVDLGLWKKLYVIGIPASLNLALPSLLISVLNVILTGYGEVYVFVLGVYYKLQTFLYLPANGIVQGMRPLLGYNYGAGEYKRVHKIFQDGLILVLVMMAAGTAICLAIPGQLMGLFSSSEATVQAGMTALRVISLGFIVSSVSVICSGALEGLGKGVHSLIISLCRYVVVIIPVAFIVSRFMGAVGVWHAFWITEAVTAVISYIVYRKGVKR